MRLPSTLSGPLKLLISDCFTRLLSWASLGGGGGGGRIG